VSQVSYRRRDINNREGVNARTGKKRSLGGWGLVLIVFVSIATYTCHWKTERPGPQEPTAGRDTDGGLQARREPTGPTPAALSRMKRLNDAARFFSGLGVDPSSEFYDLTRTEAWKCFAERQDALWAGFEKAKVKMRPWARAELDRFYNPATPVFYPFGGPDIVYAETFFPSANRYVLVGLENLGSVPGREAIPPYRLDDILTFFNESVQDIIRLSFFRVKVMKQELSKPMVDGVIPLFLVLLARTGYEVEGLDFGGLDGQGEFQGGPAPSGDKDYAVRIQFRTPGNPICKTLLYLSFNLIDVNIKKSPAFNKFLQANVDRCFTFIKSASYLMRKAYFSAIRQTILNQSYAVLQDDSGLSFRSFDKNSWEVSLYGRYGGPVDLFVEHFEPDLMKAYKSSSKRLNFRFGYALSSNLLLAVKKAP